MNNITPFLRGTRSTAIDDAAVIRAMETILKDKLRDAVAACYAEARSLQALDADAVMAEVNKYFSPEGAFQSDNLSDAFFNFKADLRDALEAPQSVATAAE